MMKIQSSVQTKSKYTCLAMKFEERSEASSDRTNDSVKRYRYTTDFPAPLHYARLSFLSDHGRPRSNKSITHLLIMLPLCV